MLQTAVILINYNSSTYTIKCIESILQKTNINFNYKIYVVDNNSQKTDYQNVENYLKLNHNDKVSLHRSNINKGFGGGNMFGLQFAEPSEFVAFVNNDTLFLNDCLQILYDFIKNKPSVAIVGGQSFDEKNKEIVSFDHYASTTRQIFGRRFLERLNSEKFPKRKQTYLDSLKVNTVSGSFMMINRNEFNKIGGFDENLFLYYEETDLSLRLKYIGKDCYIVPQAKYVHYHGASTERNVTIKKELKISLTYLVQKHYGLWSKKILLTYLCFTSFFSSILKPKKWTFFSLYFQGAPLSKSLKTKQKITEF